MGQNHSYGRTTSLPLDISKWDIFKWWFFFWPMAGQTTPARIIAVILLELSDEKTKNGWTGSSFLGKMSRQDHLVIPATEAFWRCLGLSVLNLPYILLKESLLLKLARVGFSCSTQTTLTDTAHLNLSCSICTMNLGQDLKRMTYFLFH